MAHCRPVLREHLLANAALLPLLVEKRAAPFALQDPPNAAGAAACVRRHVGRHQQPRRNHRERSEQPSHFLGSAEWRSTAVALLALNSDASSFHPEQDQLGVTDELATPPVLGARLRRLVRTRVSPRNQHHWVVFDFVASNINH